MQFRLTYGKCALGRESGASYAIKTDGSAETDDCLNMCKLSSSQIKISVCRF